MIQITDKGSNIEVDNGKEIRYFLTWDHMVENIGSVKLYNGQNLYIREDNKLYRVRLNGERIYPKGQ